MTWTKADLRRMQAGLDHAQARARAAATVDKNDAHRERVNALLAEHALDCVCDYLRTLVRFGGVNSRMAAEGRAACRLLARLQSEPLPLESLTLPTVELQQLSQCEQERVDRLVGLNMPESAQTVVIMAEVRREREAEAARVEAQATPVAVPLYQVDVARDRRTIAVNLADVLARGSVEVHAASSDAFGTDTAWGDVEGVVSWVAFARPVALRHEAQRGFDRCTTSGESWSLDARAAMLRLWSEACAEETLPDVLDLRGAPESHGVLVETWREALAVALRKASRGVVLLVDREAWALARLLPDRVGRSS